VAETIQRNQLKMAEQFRLADWMRPQWDALKSLSRVEVASKAQTALNITITDKNVESVATAAGLEFDPPPRAIRAGGAATDPQHTRDMVEAAQLMMEVAQAGQQQMAIIVQQLRAVETRLQELERSMNAAAAS